MILKRIHSHDMLSAMEAGFIMARSVAVTDAETEYFNLRARQPPFQPILAYNFEGINLLTSMAG